MSCICQYIVSSSSSSSGTNSTELDSAAPPTLNGNDAPAAERNEAATVASKDPVSDDTKIAVCVSELVESRAEIWLLKKKLLENESTIDNLEQMVSTIVNKQNQMLSEMFTLRKKNKELKAECELQRDYHAIERNALIKELKEVKDKALARERLLALSDEAENSDGGSQPDDKDSESESDDDLSLEAITDDDEQSEVSSSGSLDLSSPPFTPPSSPLSSLHSSQFTAYSETEGIISEDEDLYSNCEDDSADTDTDLESD